MLHAIVPHVDTHSTNQHKSLKLQKFSLKSKINLLISPNAMHLALFAITFRNLPVISVGRGGPCVGIREAGLQIHMPWSEKFETV